MERRYVYPFLSSRVHTTHQGDLLGDDVTSPAPQFNGQAVQNSQDLLAEIFGGPPSSTSPSLQPASSVSPQPQKNSIQDILGLFDASPNPASPTPLPSQSAPSTAFSLSQTQVQSPVQTQTPPIQQQPRLTSYAAYDKNELKITLTPQTSAARPGVVNIMARFQVSGANTATGLHFQAAVPKVCLVESEDLQVTLNLFPGTQSQQLQMLPMSNPDVQPGATETQQMRVVAPPGVSPSDAHIGDRLNCPFLDKSNVRLRLRIAFTLAGQAIQDQVDFSGFPPGLTGSA